MTAIHYPRLKENGLVITASASHAQCNEENVCQTIPTQEDTINYSFFFSLTLRPARVTNYPGLPGTTDASLLL